MQSPIRTTRRALERLLLTVGVCAFAGAVPTAVLADAALFQGTLVRDGVFPTTMPVIGTPTKLAQLQGGTSPAGFTVPAGGWGTAFSFTTSFLPTYPYIKATVTRAVYTGDFTKSYFAPNTTITLMKQDALYPNAAPTTSAAGLVRLKVGPNGFGGPMVVRRKTTYDVTKQGVVGYTEQIGTLDVYYGSGAGGTSAYRWCCGFSTGTNTVTGGTNGIAWVWDPTQAHATGTATASNPMGPNATYSTRAAVDARNPAGTTGTIQLVSPRLAYSYSLPGQVPPRDGTGAIGSLVFGNVGFISTELTFLPEPSRVLLLGGGILGLLGAYRLRRH